MINLVTRLFDWLQRSWLWTLFEPVVLLVAIYGIALSGYWRYLQWRYDGAVTLELFSQSHLLLRFTIIFWAVVLAFAVVLYGTFRTGVADPVVRRRRLAWKAVSGGVILLAIPLAAHVLSPRDDAGPIRVMLTAADEFAPPDESLATAGSSAGNVDLRRPASMPPTRRPVASRSACASSRGARTPSSASARLASTPRPRPSRCG